jgi:hypothetical protein
MAKRFNASALTATDRLSVIGVEPCQSIEDRLQNDCETKRRLFSNAVASLPLRPWRGSTCAFGAMHGGMEQDGTTWVMCERVGASIGQISQILVFGRVGQVLVFGWTVRACEKGGDGLESMLDLFGCILDADGCNGFCHPEPVFDASGFMVSQTLVSRQVEDVAIGSQRATA